MVLDATDWVHIFLPWCSTKKNKVPDGTDSCVRELKLPCTFPGNALAASDSDYYIQANFMCISFTNRDIRTIFYLEYKQRSHNHLYVLALFFTQSYSIPSSRKAFNSPRFPALTVFTLCYQALLSMQPEMQNTAFYK